MSVAVWQIKLLNEYKLSTPNQGPFIPFLDKNSDICAKITCEIHAYRIDMGWPVTFDSSGTAWISLITDLKGYMLTELWRINPHHISGVTEKYRENIPMKLTSKFIIFVNEFILSYKHTITEA